MIYKRIFQIHTVKGSNSSISNNSIWYKSKLNRSKYCYVLLKIQLNICDIYTQLNLHTIKRSSSSISN